MKMTYKEVLPGVKLRVVESNRFETNCISIQFLSKISDETAAKMTLVPRILRRGTMKHPDMESLAAALDDMYGARIEPVSRKYGDIMTSGFICDFVDAEEKSLSAVMNLLGEIMFNPKLSEDEFLVPFVDGERANLIDEIKSEINNKMSHALRRAIEHMFKNGPYAVNELGSEEAVEMVDAKSLFRYYKKMISECPCEIFFCGRYSYEEVEEKTLRIFKLCQRGKIKSVMSETPVCTEGIRIRECMDIAQTNLIIGLKTYCDDIYALKLMTTVLGGGTSSKLFENVREKQSLCYSTGAMFDSFKKAMFIYAGINPLNAEVAEKALLHEFRNCVDGNISDEEIKIAKKSMIDDLLTTEDSVFAMEAYWLRASLLCDEREPLEVATNIKNIDSNSIVAMAKSFIVSVTYLLAGMEGAENERKLLPYA